mmetsp:Transcript_29160/g.82778  ORF Transcript_29160/g.82778 Transcript_29160/m.82778 type:complete len:152 (+) Transcript_29160:2-457(+)
MTAPFPFAGRSGPLGQELPHDELQSREPVLSDGSYPSIVMKVAVHRLSSASGMAPLQMVLPGIATLTLVSMFAVMSGAGQRLLRRREPRAGARGLEGALFPERQRYEELPLFRNMVLPLSLEPQRSDELVEGGELSELDKLREDASADAEP